MQRSLVGVSVTFTATSVGEHAIDVQVKNQRLTGAPFRSVVALFFCLHILCEGPPIPDDPLDSIYTVNTPHLYPTSFKIAFQIPNCCRNDKGYQQKNATRT